VCLQQGFIVFLLIRLHEPKATPAYAHEAPFACTIDQDTGKHSITYY
jgi:hypothetical protein